MQKTFASTIQSCHLVVFIVAIGLSSCTGLECRYVSLGRRNNFMSNRHSIGVRYLTHKIERLKSSRDDLIESIENAENNDKNSIGTTVTVSYEGQSCNIIVLPNESILAALERQSIYVQSQLTTLPDMPSDCRRGNCMTCAALIKNNNNKSPSSRGNFDRHNTSNRNTKTRYTTRSLSLSLFHCIHYIYIFNSGW